MELQGEVAIFVGGAGGMGKAISLLLSSEGAHLNIVDKSQERCNEIKKELLAFGKKPGVFAIGITSKKKVTRVVQSGMNRQGKVDILVNADGIVDMGPTEDIKEEDWDRMMAATKGREEVNFAK